MKGIKLGTIKPFTTLIQNLKSHLKSIFKLGRLHKKPNFDAYHLFEESIEMFNKKKLLFIHVPKTAGISIYSTIYDRNDTYGHFSLSSYQQYMPKRKFNKIKKFTVVRNPYDRIISAYYFLYGGGINKKDENWANNNLNQYQNFEDFVLNGLAKKTVQSYIHFHPQVFFLKNKNGEIKLDYILSTENIDEDIKQLKMGSNSLELKKINKSNRKTNVEELPEEVKNKIYEIYKEDFILLGFPK